MLDARRDLLAAQATLATWRQRADDPSPLAPIMHALAVSALYRALDRAWEAQCMAQGSY